MMPPSKNLPGQMALPDMPPEPERQRRRQSAGARPGRRRLTANRRPKCDVCIQRLVVTEGHAPASLPAVWVVTTDDGVSANLCAEHGAADGGERL